jgi:hypothetical protein
MHLSSRRALFLCALGLAAGLASACNLDHTAGPLPDPIQSGPPVAQTPAPPTEIYGCGLPRGTGLGRSCGRESPQFMDAINEAIDYVEINEPHLFRDLLATGGEYMDEVVDRLRKRGFCALNDGEEIAIKNSNDFSEQYDILSSGGHVLRAYMVTCRPAWDAIPPAGDNS